MQEVSERTDFPISVQATRPSASSIDIAPSDSHVISSSFRARSNSFGSSQHTDAVQRSPVAQVAQAVAESTLFRIAVNIIIIASAIQMGLATDIHDSRWKTFWVCCEHIFTACFLLESVLLMVAYQFDHFKDSWNLFDFFIMVISVMDSWVLPALNASSLVGFRQFRLLRLLRIAKLTKVSPELTVVVEGLLNSMKSMIWIFVLLLVILYAAAIFCVQTVGSTDSGFASYEDRQDIIDEQLVDDFNNYVYFGSISRSMVTLFGIVLLSEWALIRPVAEVHPAMIPFFVIVVVLVTFGVLNVIIGIVVEKTTSAVHKFRQDRVHAGRKEQASIARQLCDLAFELDTDGDARISIEELRASFQNERLRQLFDRLDLPLGFEAVEFLYMLDVDGNGSLTKQEFVHGILRLIFCTDFQRDCLHNMSIGALHHSMHKATRDLREELRQGIAKISQEIKSLRSLDHQHLSECSRGLVTGNVDKPKSHQDDIDKATVVSSDCIQMFAAILHKQGLGCVQEDTSTITSVSTALPITPPVTTSAPLTPRRTEGTGQQCHARIYPASPRIFTIESHAQASMKTISNISEGDNRDSASLLSQNSLCQVGEVSVRQKVDLGTHVEARVCHGDISKQATREGQSRESDRPGSARNNWRV